MEPTVIRVARGEGYKGIENQLESGLVRTGVVDKSVLSDLLGVVKNHMETTQEAFVILINPYRANARYSKTARVRSVGDIEVFFYPGGLVTFYVPSGQ